MIPQDIGDLLKEVDQHFKDIKSFKIITKNKIRSVILDLASILDYASNHIADISSKRSRKPQFPYANIYISIEEFEKNFEKMFPSIIVNHNEIYNLILSMQHFKTETPWLFQLIEFNNFNKHNGITEVKSKEGKIYESLVVNGMSIVGGDLSNSTIRFRNTMVNGRYVDDIDFNKGSIEVVKKREASFDFKITKDKKIVYGNNEIEIIPFLDKCIINIHNFIVKLFKILYCKISKKIKLKI